MGGGFAYGDLGMSHHATEDIAMMRALPNMRVYVPADVCEAHVCLKDACSFISSNTLYPKSAVTTYILSFVFAISVIQSIT